MAVGPAQRRPAEEPDEGAVVDSYDVIDWDGSGPKFALLADRQAVLQRLRERGLGHVVQLVAGKDAPLRRESFAVSKLDQGACLINAFGRPASPLAWPAMVSGSAWLRATGLSFDLC